MNAPPTVGLQHLVVSCHQASERYHSAARAVGDPGLRLQFKHLAAARVEMGTELSIAAGVVAATQAVDARVPATAGPSSAPGPSPAASSGGCGRVILGGEDDGRPLERDELCALVRGLREHDESMLGDFRRMRPDVTRDVAAALDRFVELLLADLEKMRILEDLARDVPNSAGSA